MAQKISIHRNCLHKRIAGLQTWQVPDSVRSEIRRFLDELALGKVNKGYKISERRQTKYMDLLRPALEFLNRPTSRIRITDVEAFERALTTGAIQSRHKGQSYSHTTQVDIRKALRIFLRWRLGEGKAQTLAGWLDTRYQFKTPDFLTEEQVSRLFQHCRTVAQRFLVAMLFDSGARAEEFHNIRFQDVELPTDHRPFVRITLREEYSKTKGRTVSLYWRPSTDAVTAYITDRLQEHVQPEDPVFATRYDAARRSLHRLGKQVLGRTVNYHLFRHSSATHYASKLNRQELCYRYGWRFSSDMPDVYISRAGMTTPELDRRFAEDTKTDLLSHPPMNIGSIQTVQSEHESLALQLRLLREELAAVKKNIVRSGAYGARA